MKPKGTWKRRLRVVAQPPWLSEDLRESDEQETHPMVPGPETHNGAKPGQRRAYSGYN